MSFCQVCGHKARRVNYGTLTCESCSAFFRRHGFHPEVRIKNFDYLMLLMKIFLLIECWFLSL
jgi:ribosomal protein L37AE/L43A